MRGRPGRGLCAPPKRFQPQIHVSANVLAAYEETVFLSDTTVVNMFVRSFAMRLTCSKQCRPKSAIFRAHASGRAR